jgi:hypothetical protein
VDSNRQRYHTTRDRVSARPEGKNRKSKDRRGAKSRLGRKRKGKRKGKSRLGGLLLDELHSVLASNKLDAGHLFSVEDDTVAVVGVGDHLRSEGRRDELGGRGELVNHLCASSEETSSQDVDKR